jgi:hypothetical protein
MSVLGYATSIDGEKLAFRANTRYSRFSVIGASGAVSGIQFNWFRTQSQMYVIIHCNWLWYNGYQIIYVYW